MLNYEIEPQVLHPYLPAGTELDLWDGKALISVVGFLFQNTKVRGLSIPFHRSFEEVNLRFYVRRKEEDGERRGVAFIKEIVPLPAVAFVANNLYGENYAALPMRHTIETHRKTGALCKDGLVEYAWRLHGKLNRLGALSVGDPQPLIPGSEEEFITEHYWGYTRLSGRSSGSYQVEHPAWQVWQVAQPYLLCNITDLYGAAFEPYLRHRPRSAFLAEGSPVSVYPGKKIRVPKRKP